MSLTYWISVEVPDSALLRFGLHVASEQEARAMAERHYHARVRAERPVVTVALLDAAGRLLDCYDGKWAYHA